MSSSFSPLAFLTEFKDVFKKLFVFTPGISKGYWNAKNKPFCALTSTGISLRLSPLKFNSPETSYPFFPDKTLASVLLPEPFGPIIA